MNKENRDKEKGDDAGVEHPVSRGKKRGAHREIIAERDTCGIMRL